MTFEELERSLPNGVHDGELSRLSVDYVKREATFEIDLWTGDLDSKNPEVREAYRKAVLTVIGLKFLSIEPPQADYPYLLARTVCITSNGRIDEKFDPRVMLVAENTDSQFFFITDWNSFIYFAGDEYELAWGNPPGLIN